MNTVCISIMFNVHAVSALWHAPCLPINLLSRVTFCCQYLLDLLTLRPEKIKDSLTTPRATMAAMHSPCHVRILLISACHEGEPEITKDVKALKGHLYLYIYMCVYTNANRRLRIWCLFSQEASSMLHLLGRLQKTQHPSAASRWSSLQCGGPI